MTRVSPRHRRVPHAYRAPPPPPPAYSSLLPSLPSLPPLPPLEVELPSDTDDTSRSSLSDDSTPPRRSADSTADNAADDTKASAYRAFLADGISSGQYTRSECLRELKRLVLELESACKKRGTLPGETAAAVKERRRLTTVDE
ncbi:uncharacterized protein LOC62_02G003309 [Vanrija pseudolonga]|uniref:Uncharacterized protein n=1 Tax=Vanrija pseudolonga TaxID=143232 RepID=A0AAF0YA36_9TREE|nr:hypothetical protein LOC62_02G003309 [Vanrija pseudolonga]